MDIIINDLFQEIENLMIMNTFLSNVKDNNTVENSKSYLASDSASPGKIKVHPTATMIKESFRNIGDGDILGFHKSYFLKCYKKTIHTIFQVSNTTEHYWNNLF